MLQFSLYNRVINGYLTSLIRMYYFLVDIFNEEGELNSNSIKNAWI